MKEGKMIDAFGLHCDTYRCVHVFEYIEEDGDEWGALFQRARQAGWITVIVDDGDQKDYCPTCARKLQPKPPPEYYTLPMRCAEVRHVIEALGMNFNLGNALKYLYRAGRKPSADYADDLRKAMDYIRWELERLDREGSLPRGA